MLEFTIHFRGPFRIGGSDPVDLFDAPVNRANPLPASSLKGLMRAEASERLGIPPRWVEAVFGSPAVPCPWWWSDAVLQQPSFQPTTRVRVDDVGRTMRGFLRFGEQVWATTAHFSVERVLQVAPQELDRHHDILLAAAASVTSLGESRLRGSGWVDIRPGAAPPDLSRRIRSLTEEALR